jgi:hypothetical protein
MRIEEYKECLSRRGFSDDVVEKRMAVVGALAGFLSNLCREGTSANAGKAEVERFARKLVAEGRNTLENLSFLCDYADWLDHRELYVALIELMDCHNALEVLADEIEERHGREVRDRIFSKALPPLGASEKERCAYTQMVMEQMARQITPTEARAAWFQVQHGIPADAWCESDMADRERFRQCGSI